MLDHADLVQKVFERKLTAHHAGGVLLGLLVIDDLLEVAHQAYDVTHAEHTARHAFGTEGFELIRRFAHTDERDGSARDFFHAEGGATTRIAVEFRQDDAGDPEPFVEGTSGLYGVLANHRVDDEQDVVRFRRGFDLGELVHQHFVNRKATSRVVNDDVAAGFFCFCRCSATNVDGRLSLEIEHRDFELLAQYLQLVDGGSALHVGSNQHRLFAFALHETRELRSRRRFTRTLQTHHDDRGRALVVDLERFTVGTHHCDEFVMTSLDEDFSGTHAVRFAFVLHARLRRKTDGLFFDARQKPFCYAKLDVGVEEGLSNLRKRRTDVVVGELSESERRFWASRKPLMSASNKVPAF